MCDCTPSRLGCFAFPISRYETSSRQGHTYLAVADIADSLVDPFIYLSKLELSFRLVIARETQQKCIEPLRRSFKLDPTPEEIELGNTSSE
ncbi:hypothetical protein DTO164E3_6380 [Paecilomyces variotii]|nr:hypothetical protein DTO164E3_6380 [Paecilomyces variotii]KAJ9357358.1 hypothetical protein DTO027B9_3061 [Paecilomyces variotii]KAJ9377457.1 hypothetical protein DTO063F5_8267 [Paecilomyces variotii]KAJ9407898.1 hypothetical protein DTO045G8_4365 [Paecilomyces variotii]